MEGGKREADCWTSRECHPSPLGESRLEVRKSTRVACAREGSDSTGSDAGKGRARGQIVEKVGRTRSNRAQGQQKPRGRLNPRTRPTRTLQAGRTV